MPEELQLPVKEGDIAPLFSAQTGGGPTVALADLRGKNIVLYFYPRDNTPGCTIEACRFRDQFEDFTKHGIVVLGVSADSAAPRRRSARRRPRRGRAGGVTHIGLVWQGRRAAASGRRSAPPLPFHPSQD
jgi:alkyl hydroperoxide reductase subunit AhpC